MLIRAAVRTDCARCNQSTISCSIIHARWHRPCSTRGLQNKGETFQHGRV